MVTPKPLSAHARRDQPGQPVFLATKVGASGRAAGSAQIERSFHLLQRKRLDLIAVHNLQDIDAQIPLLHEIKAAGRIRYVGAQPPRATASTRPSKR